MLCPNGAYDFHAGVTSTSRQMSNTHDKEKPASRQFRQQRSRDTYLRLLEAAKHVFGAKGYDNTQTPDIAKQAGVSVGSFYRYFTDKRQIFLELARSELQQTYRDIFQDISAQTLRQKNRRGLIAASLDALFERVAENPGLHREFVGMAMRDEEVKIIRQDIEDAGTEFLATIIGELVDENHIPDPHTAARVIVVAAQEVATAVVGARFPHDPTDPFSAVRTALTDMIERYVFASIDAANSPS